MIDIISAIPRHKTRQPPLVVVEAITHIYIHHAGVWGRSAEQHARFQVAPKGTAKNGRPTGRNWPIFAYKGYTSTDGINYLTGYYFEKGYHVGGRNAEGIPFNDYSIGHLIEGNYEEKPPTEEVLNAAVEAVLAHEARLGRRLIIGWHDEAKLPAKYACPGKYFPRERFVKMVEEAYAPEVEDEPEVPLPENEPEAPGPENEPKLDPDQDFEDPMHPTGCASFAASIALLVLIITLSGLFNA
jgi:hypothetical protein